LAKEGKNSVNMFLSVLILHLGIFHSVSDPLPTSASASSISIVSETIDLGCCRRQNHSLQQKRRLQDLLPAAAAELTLRTKGEERGSGMMSEFTKYC
jgi:hypothetical protein